MAGLSSNGESTVLSALLTSRFVSLHTADPGNTGVNEVAGSGYARQSATFTNTGNNPTQSKNNAIIEFPPAGGSWGTVTHFGIWSAVSGGTYLGGGAITVPKAVALDDVVRWPVDALVVQVD